MRMGKKTPQYPKHIAKGLILNLCLWPTLVPLSYGEVIDPVVVRGPEEVGNEVEARQEDNDLQWGHSQPLEGKTTTLQGLDKITARVFALEARHGQEIKFGTLRIVVRGCRKNPPEEMPEAAAFLEIKEAKPGEAARLLFSGWMFASSPEVSALEHPIYDVWVTDCQQ